MFVDDVEIVVESGHGGAGCLSFRREKFVPRGGPDGGDGGAGGSVYLVADPHRNTLLHFRYNPEHRAERGKGGQGALKTGAAGRSLEVPVPPGTTVLVADPEVEGGWAPLADLTIPGQRVLVAKGGRGGLGNARFKTATRQAPDFATPGKPGSRKRIRLSLKLMADVGLIGFPNAGKSTLLRRISAARPRVANYPFTTLVPSLGVVERGERRIVVADIPGLIEGASEGAGLGHQFLRHVERTRVLIHLLDVEGMLMQGRDLVADYHAIRRELGRYRPELLLRREIVVLSKCDLLNDPGEQAALDSALSREGLTPLRISSATNLGIDRLLATTFEAVEQARRADEERKAEE